MPKRRYERKVPTHEWSQIRRRTVHTTLNRWVEEQFAGLPDKSSRPRQPAMKTTLRAMQEVKHMQINPEPGE